MILRLDPSMLSAAQLRGGAEKALDDIVVLFTEQPGGLHHAVHEARRALKRLRAFHRLFAEGDPAFFRHQNARLRDAARLLAEGREVAALAETGEWLVTEAGKPQEAALFKRVAAVLAARREAMDHAALEANVAQVIAACRKVRGGLTDFDLPDSRRRLAKIVARGWKRILTQGNGVVLSVAGGGKGFHELRKSAQTLNACLILLRPLWPQAMLARQEMLRPIIAALGRENDLAGLALLMERSPQDFGEPIEQVVLQRLITQRREALQRTALQQAESVFAINAKEDANRIALLWETLSR